MVGESYLSDLAPYAPKFVTDLQASLIERDISDSEILTTLKSMKKYKSPGPDGFNVNFFLLVWDIVGSDFTLAIQSFFK